MAPRTAEQNERIRQQRRQEILEAAFQVYVARGYRGLEIADVAKTAGVATGLVHYYFKGKQKLVQELFEWQLSLAREANDEVFQPAGDARESLRQYVELYLRVAADYPDHLLFFQRVQLDFSEVFAPGSRDDLQAAVMDFQSQLGALLRGGMEAGVFVARPPELMSQLLWHMVAGAMQYLMQHAEPKESVDEAIALIADRCLALLGD